MMASSGPVTLFGHVCSIGGQKREPRSFTPSQSSELFFPTRCRFTLGQKNIVFTSVSILHRCVH